MARYAREGIDVHIAIATDGVAGSVADGYEDTLQELVAVRTRELRAAVDVLGGTLHMLGFRDSGYIGDPANEHPQAFINIDETLSSAPVVSLIRELRPDVVVTHDEDGGYFHPDHIQCWRITTRAFFAAGDSGAFVEDGLAPYKPQRLYYSAFPNRMVKIFTLLMRLRGQDPTKMGRNEDIDFTRLGRPHSQLNARIDYAPYWEVKKLASAEHASQGGGTGNSRALPDWFQRRFMAKEYYIRAFPEVREGYIERDLFTGL